MMTGVLPNIITQMSLPYVSSTPESTVSRHLT